MKLELNDIAIKQNHQIIRAEILRNPRIPEIVPSVVRHIFQNTYIPLFLTLEVNRRSTWEHIVITRAYNIKRTKFYEIT